MANVDHYAVLELSQTAQLDAIKAAYRRLAKIRHPDKNPGDPAATAKFQKLNSAYSTLSDPLQRRLYDSQYQPSRTANASGYGTQGTWNEAPNPGTSNNKNSNYYSESDAMRKHRQRQEELSRLLQTLGQQRTSFEKDILSAQAKLRERKTALEKLKAEAEKDKADEAARRGWFGFLWRLTPEQQEERNRNATARRTGMLVIEAQIQQYTSALKEKKELLQRAQEGISDALRQKARVDQEYNSSSQAEQRRQQAEEQRKFAEAQQERLRKERAAQEAEARRRNEEAARAAEAYRARQAAEAQKREEAAEELARKFQQAYEATQAAAKRSREAREAAQARSETQRSSGQSRQEGRGAKKFQRRRTPGDGARQTASCRHRAWWEQISGPNSCQRCQRRTPRFAFRCPGCQVVACADCRVALKEGG
ncbi:hypothetical protein B0I35DRAFT_423930 [Stachybotrys elegans]|uniref:J domain-containing protein n=1 Tax=Stachybotrys elegans TaxID=80388 RepID=A0A8K0WTJ9_9HYPO|nr:hypothetical protein B0I35DRAFT_423930 [Stachybotrys elegans]